MKKIFYLILILFLTAIAYLLFTKDTKNEITIVDKHTSINADSSVKTKFVWNDSKEDEYPDEYTDFSCDIRPSVDFVHELMSYTDGLEVLEPMELRQKIYNSFQASLERYSNKNV